MMISQLLLTVLWLVPFTPDQDESRQEMRVLSIQNAEAESLNRQVIQLMGPNQVRPVVDARTNRIVLIGLPEEVERFAELVKVLDVPATQSRNVTTEVIRLQHRTPGALTRPLHGELSGSGSLVEDVARNAIVVRDEESRVAAIRSLISELDVAPGMCSIEIQALAEGAETPMSKDIQEEMLRMKLTGYGVSMTAATQTVEGEEFSVESRYENGSLDIAGWARILDGRKQIELRLKVEATDNGPWASIRSTIRIPVGQHVILGMTPHGAGKNRPLVLVVRATLP
ncbi:MAG: secretin N-terminal domain-containing protein [Planctomycetota bacterium]